MNPYASSQTPVIPHHGKQRLPVTVLRQATFCLSGVLFLGVRDLTERTFTWINPSDISTGELALYALLVSPSWGALSTQATLAVAPGFIALLLALRQRKPDLMVRHHRSAPTAARHASSPLSPGGV